MTTSRHILSLAGALLLSLCRLHAVTVDSIQQTMADALKLRGDMATGIVNGSEKSAAALGRLHAQAAPSGLIQLDHDADFALAAIDVGQRLLAAGKADVAEDFFRAAEQALLLAINRIPDAKAQEKALYLQQLAHIRINYLNEGAVGSDNMDAAIGLQPNDANLKFMKSNLTRGRADPSKAKQ